MAYKADATEVKGHCPNCGGERTAQVVGVGRDRWDDDDGGLWGDTVYRVLRCKGCETFFFQKQSIFSEDIDQWYGPDGEVESALNVTTETWPPPVKHEEPEWANHLYINDALLGRLLSDVYKAVNYDLNLFAAIGARTVFDRASELLEVDQSLTFQEKLACLKEVGKISDSEKEFLNTVINAGSAAAHRGWEPKSSEMSKLLLVLEGFLLRSFILPVELEAISERIPNRPPRRSKD